MRGRYFLWDFVNAIKSSSSSNLGKISFASRYAADMNNPNPTTNANKINNKSITA
jgi:hypothetical protein